jgi:hypothetical protein
MIPTLTEMALKRISRPQQIYMTTKCITGGTATSIQGTGAQRQREGSLTYLVN